MRAAGAVLAIAAVVLAGVVLVSGGSDADPATPPALPGLPPPFLGTVVTGDGGMAAALDAYGDVVNLYAPGPAGTALIDNSSARQAAGTVPSDTGIVPRVRVGGGPALPPWRADSVRQGYVRGTNAVRTVAVFGRAGIGSASSGGVQLVETAAAHGEVLAVVLRTEQRRGEGGVGPGGGGSGRAGADASADASFGIDVEAPLKCETGRRGSAVSLVCRDRSGGGTADAEASPASDAGRAGDSATFAEAVATLRLATRSDRRWLARARPLGAPRCSKGSYSDHLEHLRDGSGKPGGQTPPCPGAGVGTGPRGSAPTWARRIYERSLLTLRALTGSNGGAAAGAREGWAYVWPRDAAADALALDAAGFRGEARRAARFLTALPIDAAARFDEAGNPVPGRGPQGDAAGWIAAASAATGVRPGTSSPEWRDLPDYREGTPGDYLGNAIAALSKPAARARSIGAAFGTPRGLVRTAEDPGSGLDSAAAWAVRPFALRQLYPDARRTLLRLAADGTRFGITPGEGWTGGVDPWTAPTAWSAWALAGLARDERVGAAADRATALDLLADLRRAATPAGALPERVDAGTGRPRSTTPLLWSHAFAVLALRELWP